MNIYKKVEEQAELCQELLDLEGGNLDSVTDKLAYEAMHNIAVMHSKLRTWKEHDQKTFMLSKDLIEAFMHTDIPWDLTPNDFNYPFDIFMVEADTPLFTTHLPTANGQLPVYGILFLDANTIEREIGWVTFEGKKVKRPNWDYALTGFYHTGQGIENLMMHMRGHENFETAASSRKPGNMIFELEHGDVKNMINLFYNTILYVNDPSRRKEETQESRTRSFKDSKTKKFYESKYILLKPPKDYKSISSETGRKMDKRFIVRGHWRNQAHGERLALRKKIWIKPFAKGDVLAELSNRKYVVQ